MKRISKKNLKTKTEQEFVSLEGASEEKESSVSEDPYGLFYKAAMEENVDKMKYAIIHYPNEIRPVIIEQALQLALLHAKKESIAFLMGKANIFEKTYLTIFFQNFKTLKPEMEGVIEMLVHKNPKFIDFMMNNLNIYGIDENLRREVKELVAVLKERKLISNEIHENGDTPDTSKISKI